MQADGFSYAISQFEIEDGFSLKKGYKFKCDKCKEVIKKTYYHRRIKGHVTCWKCQLGVAK